MKAVVAEKKGLDHFRVHEGLERLAPDLLLPVFFAIFLPESNLIVQSWLNLISWTYKAESLLLFVSRFISVSWCQATSCSGFYTKHERAGWLLFKPAANILGWARLVASTNFVSQAHLRCHQRRQHQIYYQQLKTWLVVNFCDTNLRKTCGSAQAQRSLVQIPPGVGHSLSLYTYMYTSSNYSS